MKRTLLFLAGLAAIVGCSPAVDIGQLEEDLLKTDREFSEVSVTLGVYEAFDRYMDDAAMLLRDNSHPIRGREAIRGLLTPQPQGSLKWEPEHAEVAKSGDLGYTIGRWQYTTTDSTGASRTDEGYYVTIWKKQADGSWKYVFDAGTEGVPGE